MNFCTIELSSFYFDIRKDVLYCDSLNSKKKKRLYNCIKHNSRKLTKMACTNTSFTSDEIYSLIKNKEKSIHEHSFVNIPDNWENVKLNEKWIRLFKIRQVANVAIEEKDLTRKLDQV